ncbi:MFS transporter [Sphaerisporangium corydalis]|uniref:MFS transporter n=1 Tax=Sphaerisporangium corydalis TaxID=1441875 RepID=A0ABV9ERF5_9ACTN|nr:MFS transporter [Sphaerisporangium corydalis]
MRMPKFRNSLWAVPNARRLMVVSIIDSAGNGAFTSASVVLFTTVLLLTPAQIGQGLALGAVIGLSCSVLWGGLADRIGVRKVLISLQLWRAAGFVAYAFVQNFAGFVAVVVFLSLAERASQPILLSFVTSAVDDADRVKTAGALRSIRNAGFTLGALIAAIILLLPGRVSMLVVVLGNAATFAIAAYLLRRIVLRPETVPVRKTRGPSRDLVRRRPAFLVVTALAGLLSIHRQILAVGVPLWIVTHHLAPQSLIGVLIAVNAVLVVVLQVRMTRGTEDANGASRALRRSGWLLLACTGLLAATHENMAAAPWSLGALLVLATLALTFAEMWQASGSWGLSLLLSPAASRARFLAVFNLGFSAMDVCGAFVLAALVLPAGPAGWLALGVLLALAGLATPPVARWAERERIDHEPVTVPEEDHVH